MAIDEEIIRRIRAVHPDAVVELRDLTGGGDHWEARVVAPTFAGLTSLARQRSVYGALGDLMKGPVHALALQTLTPEQALAQANDSTTSH